MDTLPRRLCLFRGGPLKVPFHFANVLIFSGLAILFVLGSLLAGRFLRPHYPTAEKEMIYECGEKPIGQAWFSFNPRFYLIALVFVIFEVEIAFMFPVASVYKWFLDHGQGLLAFAEIFVFVAILAVGLAYVWAMGDLEWVKGLKQDVIKAAREKAEAARKAA
ncbi:MAG TPA: NADH-quinone oxidoreductase subunit A [Myxococcales bacterium]|nr:NADH-quinone oxidoreductase subunit A [Myxococcales bacterium]